ncbi:MAG: Asp23/Gls24 family envelope stress response protein [Clostridia bacterium]|nr:Asp23/Gls24 family envelope stress response protein [Clostridia bacterium]
MKAKKPISYEGTGKVTYNDGIVKGIVVLAVSEVQGVLLKNGKKEKDKLDFIKVDFDGDDVTVEVTVDVVFGYNVPDVAFDVQEGVKRNVESMSRYKVSSVNVHVESVVMQESAND